MIQPGTRIEMSKGYRKTKGVIKEKTDSPYEFYVICLDNNINIIAGPSSFFPIQAKKVETEQCSYVIFNLLFHKYAYFSLLGI